MIMDFKHILRFAWSMMKLTVCGIAIGYIISSLFITFTRTAPQKVFKASTANIRLSDPIHKKAEDMNIDKGVIIFIHNSFLAILFIAPVFLAGWGRSRWMFHSGGNRRPGGSWDEWFGRSLISAMGLSKDAGKNIVDLSFLLNAVNRLATGILALLLGVSCAAGANILKTPLLLIASLLPHGIIELPALCFAAGLPLALFAVLRSEVEKDGDADTFVISRRIASSKTVIMVTAGIFIALFIAGQIEDKVTPLAYNYAKTIVKASQGHVK